MVNVLPEPYDKVFMMFFFVYVRVSTVIFVTPVLNNKLVFKVIRAGLAFWVAVILVGPSWGLHEAAQGYELPYVDRVFNGVVDFSMAVAGEILIGLVLGFIANILLQTIGISGEIIGQQAGFSAASVFDPISGQDIFLMAQINTLLGTMLFLIINGPETVLSVLADSFYVLRPGEAYAFANLTDVVYHTFIYDGGAERAYALASIMYKVGVQIAAPMIASMLLVSIAEAFIARAVPQLNIMVVGFAIRVSMGLIILISVLPFFAKAFIIHLSKYTHYAEVVLLNIGNP